MSHSRSSSPLVRGMAMLLYYGVASHLPEYSSPGGRIGRALRQMCAHKMLDKSGDWVNVGPRVNLGKGAQITLGDQSSIGRDSRVEAVVIEDAVMIGPELLVIARNHRFIDPNVPIGWQGTTEGAPPVIGYGSWIGARVTLLPGVVIGKFCVIGAGSVITRNIADYCVAAGNPARVVRTWGGPNHGNTPESIELTNRQASQDVQQPSR